VLPLTEYRGKKRSSEKTEKKREGGQRLHMLKQVRELTS